MSYSLQISNGDLAIGSPGLKQATGVSKLTQDLRCAILEQMGTDPLHPSYGSTLDGGVDPTTGDQIPSLIGRYNNANSGSFVKAEIQRICNAYQAQQVARNASDLAIYGRSTLTADETLLSVADVNVQQIEDNMLVRVTLQTGAGNVALNVPLSTV